MSSSLTRHTGGSAWVRKLVLQTGREGFNSLYLHHIFELLYSGKGAGLFKFVKVREPDGTAGVLHTSKTLFDSETDYQFDCGFCNSKKSADFVEKGKSVKIICHQCRWQTKYGDENEIVKIWHRRGG